MLGGFFVGGLRCSARGDGSGAGQRCGGFRGGAGNRRGSRIGGVALRAVMGLRGGLVLFLLFVFLVIGHAYSAFAACGAKRLRSILEATMSRICFWSLLTGSVPSRTTKLSESTILSYSSRMRAWKSLKLSER